MPVSANYLAYVLDQLSSIGATRSRRMFGGIGLYCDDLFFALLANDVLYFKVDDSNRDDYVSRGCEAFRPLADNPDAVSMNYFRLPEDVLEDTDELRIWVRKSLAVAAQSAASKALRKRNKAAVARPKRANKK